MITRILISILLIRFSAAYYPTVEPIVNVSLISWCTTSLAEQAKCQDFSMAVKNLGPAVIKESLLCKLAIDKEQCMVRLDNREADLVGLDPGEVFVAGRYHSLVPIMAEKYGGENGYHAVAVIHANNPNIRNLHDLRDKRACFPGVGQLAGWVMPMVTLIEQFVLNITDCNNLVKSAAAFFGPSCAPGSLINKYNPSGDNPQKMCDLCRGTKLKRCLSSDPYAGFQGAFTCLAEGSGEIAFVKHDTVQDVTNQLWYRGPNINDFRLLCPTGLTASVSDYRNCNWGFVPPHAIVTSSAAEMSRRKQLQQFLKKSSLAFGESLVSRSSSNSDSNRDGNDRDWSNRGASNWGQSSTTNSNNQGTYSTPNPYNNRGAFNNDDNRRNSAFNRSSDPWNRDNDPRNNNNRSSDPWNRNSDTWNRDNDPRNNNNNNNNSRTTDNFNWNRDNFNRSANRDWNNNNNWGGGSTTPYGRDGRNFNNDTNRVGPYFKLFNSEHYGKFTNLMFLDKTTELLPVEDSRQTFKGYLGEYSDLIRRQRHCPSPPARLCVVSDKEYEKCLKMRVAFKAQMLKPNLSCMKAESQIGCMNLIKDNAADLTVLDAGDIYKGGQLFNLMPIISEQYDLDDSSYYVVAVAKQPDKETDLLYLKGRKSCHSAIGTAAGWIVPMGFLLSSERMRSYGCNAVKAASEFFQKSCVPGVLSREYTYGHWGYDNLCDLCHGSSSHYCGRDSQEPFYGDTGALRCIVEGGGDIAFVKHTTILENTAGKNTAWWSRPMMPDDYELLCRDGTRATHDKYANCNLGRVSANAIVTSRYRTKEDIETYIALFMYAQEFYGSKFSEDFTFKMFVSEGDFQDLIFQDATQQLRVVPDEKRDYRDYLGPHFVQAVRLVDCTAGTGSLKIHLSLTLFTAIITTIIIIR